MTTRQLQAREAKFRRASEQYEQARIARNDAIRQAIAEGKTQAQIAAALGISQVQVSRLVRGA